MSGTRILFLACLLFLEGITAGQSLKASGEGTRLKNNAIYGTAGFYPDGIYCNFLVNYDRIIFRFPNSFFHAISFRAGAGLWVAWGSKGSNYVSTGSILMGKKSSHLELGSGVLFTYNSYAQEFQPIVNERHLAGFFGYRYQKPGGEFVFRTGIGWPEGMYLSMGYCF
ncbi:MAG: hypothetical protein IPN67_02825 [Bacteroidales bacterium]|nr:hypothetical protein [Bacteroidales bacterium]MBK8881330.1 hypothetical protein [Bacteroidales bacterium]